MMTKQKLLNIDPSRRLYTVLQFYLSVVDDDPLAEVSHTSNTYDIIRSLLSNLLPLTNRGFNGAWQG